MNNKILLLLFLIVSLPILLSLNRCEAGIPGRRSADLKGLIENSFISSDTSSKGSCSFLLFPIAIGGAGTASLWETFVMPACAGSAFDFTIPSCGRLAGRISYVYLFYPLRLFWQAPKMQRLYHRSFLSIPVCNNYCSHLIPVALPQYFFSDR